MAEDEETPEISQPAPEPVEEPAPTEAPTEETVDSEEEKIPDVKQKLFLLEFIVDDISLDFCNSQQLTCFGEGKIVIEFKFLDIGPLRITEDDFQPVKKHYLEGCTGTGNIKNGKSILFGMTPQQTQEVKMKTIIYCDIFKKTERKEYHLGACMIPIINLFKELLTLVDEGGQALYFKNIKDCFKIKSMNDGDLVGHIYAYIRMSCFNEIIINKFKKDTNKELDYTPEKGYYNYKYGRADALPAPLQVCKCKDINNKTAGICPCPEGEPADNCAQIYTDNQCVYACPQNLRPCEQCPETCAANKAAGKIRERVVGMPANLNCKTSVVESDKKQKKPKKKKPKKKK